MTHIIKVKKNSYIDFMHFFSFNIQYMSNFVKIFKNLIFFIIISVFSRNWKTN